jgi:hypothetical protein
MQSRFLTATYIIFLMFNSMAWAGGEDTAEQSARVDGGAALTMLRAQVFAELAERHQWLAVLGREQPQQGIPDVPVPGYRVAGKAPAQSSVAAQ